MGRWGESGLLKCRHNPLWPNIRKTTFWSVCLKQSAWNADTNNFALIRPTMIRTTTVMAIGVYKYYFWSFATIGFKLQFLGGLLLFLCCRCLNKTTISTPPRCSWLLMRGTCVNKSERTTESRERLGFRAQHGSRRRRHGLIEAALRVRVSRDLTLKRENLFFLSISQSFLFRWGLEHTDHFPAGRRVTAPPAAKPCTERKTWRLSLKALCQKWLFL